MAENSRTLNLKPWEDDEDERKPRDLETREFDQEPEPWKPASLLPTPKPQAGYKFRWIRTAMMGESDNKNVSSRFREGWVPVKAADHPELMVMSDRGSEFPENIEIGGLLLCKAPEITVKQRRDHFAHVTRQQMASVDHAYLRANDPRMPLLQPEHRTQVSKGKLNETE